ncbi:N-alpha-acetyltransferase, non-catalitic subunit, partial [Cryomyces antarcticus]
MAWHHGAPLSQTLFTSLYVDRLLWPDTKTLEEAQFFRGREPAWKNRPLMQALRAYCLGLIKTCDLVIRTVISQHYYEEEDFVTMTYNRDLLTRYETLDVMALLVDAVSSFSNWCEERDVPVELRSAIVIRLDARHSFLAAVSTDYPSVVMKRNLTTLCGMLGKFGETHNLGRPVKEAFSEKVQRRLATTVPPRHMAEMSFRDAVTKLEKMLQDIHAALLVEETGAFKDPYNLVKFLQFWNVRESLTFARAKLQSWLFGDLKVAPSIEKLLLKDVKGLVLREDKLLDPINWTVEVPADPRHQIASLIDNFRQRASM